MLDASSLRTLISNASWKNTLSLLHSTLGTVEMPSTARLFDSGRRVCKEADGGTSGLFRRQAKKFWLELGKSPEGMDWQM